jgi:hypothetical protein
VRTVVVWLLAFALPVQSMAAATMIHCGAPHPRAHASLNATSDDAHSHSVDRAEHAHHSEADGADGALPLNASTTCSVCASCCAGAALSASVPVIADAPPARDVIADGAPSPHEFVVGRSTPPPRY